MNRNLIRWIGAPLVLLLITVTAVSISTLGREPIRTSEEFIDRLEEEYRTIEDFSARLALSGLDPPLQIEVQAISDPQVLRVEYLSPPEMKGQFFLLKEDFLYQFMPGQNLIIKKDLKNSNVPVRAANLTPNYLLELVRSEELDVNLIGSPGELTFPWIEDNVLELETSLSGQETTSSKSLQEWGLTTPVSFGSESDYYVLEIIPREEGYQFARQVIRFDPETLLPHELVTYFEDQARDPVTTGVEQVRTNVGLDLAEIEKLPEDAEIISD